MDGSRTTLINETYSGSSKASVFSNDDIAQFERRDSNLSNLSHVHTVNMAHDEMFAGAVGGSISSNLTSLTHRKSRAGSANSFSIFRANDHEFMILSNENAIIDNDSEILSDEQNLIDLESGEPSYFRTPAEQREEDFQIRRDSTGTESCHKLHEKRIGQKILISTEDLTIAIVGLQISHLRYILYAFLCSVSLGVGYLLLRWIPRWKVYLIGKPCPLRDCDWVVFENQWGEISIQKTICKKYGYAMSTVFGRIDHNLVNVYEDEDPIMNDLRILEYRYMRFLFHPLLDKFILGNTWKDPRWADISSIRAGIRSDEKENRRLIFGNNTLEIEQKSIFQLLIDEVLHPFYIFQIASLALWCLDDYYYYATSIFIISLVSITTTLLETRSTMQRLNKISRFECDIRVLRNSFWRYITSSELVPGDVYEITDPALKQIPCDSLLLAGDCIVNESMLTGESVPISKTPATSEALESLDLRASSITPEIAKHFLFGGTKIIRAKRPQKANNDDAIALAMVVRTGFGTTKGALIRSILFPKPSRFKFYRDSFRYISVMAAIAILGFIASLINFVRLQLEWHLIIVRALDLITIVIPPALPATLTIGTNFAISRLMSKQIFCTSPQRVNLGGKLDIVCFDKTGTLTEDGLDVLGIRVVHRPENRFSDLLTSSISLCSRSTQDVSHNPEYDMHKLAIHAMATCHSLRVIDGELAGDPLDVKMFQFTEWDFEEGERRGGYFDDNNQETLAPSIVRPPSSIANESNSNNSSPLNTSLEIGILKSFEFVTQLRRASVVVRKFRSMSCDVYVKGAPECMRDICKPESFPHDFEEILTYYTHRGFRVIALATKHIAKLSWVKIQKMHRSEAESDLDFIGFIIFENKLKPNTTSVLDELTRAAIRKLMCTGDNILTAISVARECNLISPTRSCYVPHFIQGNHKDPEARLRWENIDDNSVILDETNLNPVHNLIEENIFSSSTSDKHDYSLAISGDVFQWMVDFAPISILHKVLVRGQIYARMSPEQKTELIEKLQSIDYCCGFCGDGANDCGALKSADIGISLSEAEASIAAPFTSRIFDITCVPEVIREGRSALVTSFSCFKYMSLYSAIQFTSVSLLYTSASNLGDFQFLFIDLILILPIAIFMGWTKSYPILHRKRPTANLMSTKVLTPLLGQIALSILYQFIGCFLVREQTWYIPPQLNKKDSNISNSDNTVLFSISCFEYIFSGIVLSVGPPFRQPWTRNLPLVATILVTLTLSIIIVLGSSQELSDFMEMTNMSLDFKIFTILLGFSYLVVAWLSENYIWNRIADYIRKKRKSRISDKQKLYKTILDM